MLYSLGDLGNQMLEAKKSGWVLHQKNVTGTNGISCTLVPFN